MTPEERRQELGRFFRSRRDCRRPEELALPRAARRRARGLRRDEVAALSGVSLSWYTWLEQGRKINPSGNALRRISTVLHLSDDEREYVSILAGQDARAPTKGVIHDRASAVAEVQRTLDSFSAIPAVLYNTRFDVLAANASANAIAPQLSGGTGWERNLIWRFFMDQDRRNLYADGIKDPGIRNLIEALRLHWANTETEDGVNELVDVMRTANSEFDAIWKEGRVAKLSIVPGRIRPHPSLPPLQIQYSRFHVPTMPGYAISALIPSSSEDLQIFRDHLERVA